MVLFVSTSTSSILILPCIMYIQICPHFIIWVSSRELSHALFGSQAGKMLVLAFLDNIHGRGCVSNADVACINWDSEPKSRCQGRTWAAVHSASQDVFIISRNPEGVIDFTVTALFVLKQKV